MIAFPENSTKSEVVFKYFNHDLGTKVADAVVISKFNDLLPTIHSIIGEGFTHWLCEIEGIEQF